MGWKNLPHWSKGLTIGLFLGLVLSSIVTYFIHHGMKCAYGLPGEYQCGLETIEIFYFILIGTIAITIIGIIVGLIIGKIKSKK